MLNALPFAGPVSAGLVALDAVSVYPVPVAVIAQPLKLATPDAAVTVSPPGFVQLSTPPPGLVPIARVTVSVLSLLATAPAASVSATDALNTALPLAPMFWFTAGCAVNVSLAMAVVAAVNAAPGLLVQLCSNASTT